MRRVAASLALLIAVAVAGRLAWELLQPALPTVAALAILAVLSGVVFQLRRR